MEAGDYSLQEALPCGAVASREAFGKWAAYAFLNGKEIRGQMQDRNRIDAVEKPGPRTAGRRFCAATNQIATQRLRSRWRLCRLTVAACPLRASGCDLERRSSRMSAL